MKDKKRKAAGSWDYLWVGCVLTVCMLFLLSIGTVQNARAINWSEACSLTVKPTLEGLEDANVVIDLYKVADAVGTEGDDAYAFQVVEPYTALRNSLENLSEMSDSDFQNLAQQAAKIALDKENPATITVGGIAVNTSVSDLSCGLYLMIARGSDLEDYIEETEDTDGRHLLVTKAYSAKADYTFSPVLVALPSKKDVGGVVSTSNPGDWLYKLTVDLKATKSNRFGSLKIVKTLLTYETKAPATFVFQVDAYEDDSRLNCIYSDVVTMTFTDAGQQELVIADKIPVGAYVEVTEVYSGAVYTLVTDKTQTAVIAADDVASVSFTNDYDRTNGGGGAITNHFENHADGAGWNWTQK